MKPSRILYVSVIVLAALSLVQCAVLERIFGFFGVDVEAPTVLSVSPTDRSTDVPTNAAILANFSEIMDTATAEYSFSITPAATGEFSWTFENRAMMFRPAEALAINTTYAVTVSTVAEDEAGNALENPYDFEFTTGTTADTSAPAEVSDLSTSIGDTQITLTWSNPADLDFAGVRILYRTDRFPADVQDGGVAYNGTGQSVVHAGLTNGTAYYYRVFSYDQALNFSPGITTSATPAGSGLEFNVTNLQTSLVKPAGNPILSGRPGEWDSVAYDAEVVFDGSSYHMYYWGEQTGPSRRPFGHTVSTSLSVWDNASSSVSTVSSDTHAQAEAIYDSGTILLWYGSWMDHTTDDYVRYATSTDGETFSNDQLVLRHNDGTGNSWDQSLDYGIYLGGVIKGDAGGYRMWYTGREPGAHQIGYATSNDGTAWTKYSGNPVLSLGTPGAFDDTQQYVLDVFDDGHQIVLIYLGYNATGVPGMGLAYSTDGVSWTKDPGNPCDLTGGSGDWDSDNAFIRKVMKVGSTYHIWYDGYDPVDFAIGYATLN